MTVLAQCLSRHYVTMLTLNNNVQISDLVQKSPNVIGHTGGSTVCYILCNCRLHVAVSSADHQLCQVRPHDHLATR